MSNEKKISMLDRPIAITDIETTGLVPGHHEIIEIGLVLVSQRTLDVIDTFETKVMPLYPDRISASAQRVNGFDPTAWVDAPDLLTAMREYATLTPEAMFCAHNVTFDWEFMRRAFETTGVKNRMDYHRLCNMTHVWASLRHRGLTSVSQNAAAKFLGLPPEPPEHRAINGAKLAYEIFRKLAQM